MQIFLKTQRKNAVFKTFRCHEDRALASHACTHTHHTNSVIYGTHCTVHHIAQNNMYDYIYIYTYTTHTHTHTHTHTQTHTHTKTHTHAHTYIKTCKVHQLESLSVCY